MDLCFADVSSTAQTGTPEMSDEDLLLATQKIEPKRTALLEC